MIKKCKTCVNNDNCTENQKQYKRLYKKIKKIIKPKCNCFYFLNLQCDYYVKLQKEISTINGGAK